MDSSEHFARPEDQATEKPLLAHDSEELKELEKKLAELRAQGILSGGDGPRETLRPVAHVPGALERFLKARA